MIDRINDAMTCEHTVSSFWCVTAGRELEGQEVKTMAFNTKTLVISTKQTNDLGQHVWLTRVLGFLNNGVSVDKNLKSSLKLLPVLVFCNSSLKNYLPKKNTTLTRK